MKNRSCLNSGIYKDGLNPCVLCLSPCDAVLVAPSAVCCFAALVQWPVGVLKNDGHGPIRVLRFNRQMLSPVRRCEPAFRFHDALAVLIDPIRQVLVGQHERQAHRLILECVWKGCSDLRLKTVSVHAVFISEQIPVFSVALSSAWLSNGGRNNM